ncbi:DUF393 domain-containing protein [candidate division KSB1 bacterium]|nr:DUF393 domain-containing protein [candidate division KSB1 bacterium]
MDRVIIGIHGLRNKPPARVLKDWWVVSIRDSFENIGQPQLPFRFELLYWVDLLYQQPSNLFLTDADAPLYMKNPYKKIDYSSPAIPDMKRQKRLERLEKLSNQLFHNDRILQSFEGISDRFIHSRFHDLEVYLRNATGYREASDRPIRDVILERLGQLLLKYRRKKVMILAHSMGSIVAYDLLTQPDNPFHVHTLVTMGSPLGQPTIMSKFTAANPVVDKLRTPDNVEHWYNLSDLNDIVALDPTLADDYAPNQKGVTAVDRFVDNRYVWEGATNPHSIFGYLQSPECADIIYTFLTQDRSTFSLTVNRNLYRARQLFVDERRWRLRRSPARPENTHHQRDSLLYTHAKIILFDGVCNLCSAFLQFVYKYDEKQVFKFAWIQSRRGKTLLQQLGMPTDDYKTIVYIEDGRPFIRSTAFLRIVKHLKMPWPLLQAGAILPKFMRDWLYDLVARYRYRIFGKKDACLLPTGDLKSRFL